MPNTPCLVSETAAAFALGTHATEDDRKLVQVGNTTAILLCLGVSHHNTPTQP